MGNAFKAVFLLLFTSFFSACSKQEAILDESIPFCVSGQVVGYKSYCYAFKLDQKVVADAQAWTPYENGSPKEPIDNVIGLIELPKDFQQVGKRFYVRIRKANAQESDIPEYLNLPTVPKPVYVVLAVDEQACPTN